MELNNLLFLFQQAAAGAADATAEGADQVGSTIGMVLNLLIMAGIFAIFYFLMIRPQRKKEKQAKEMLNKLKAGDRVTTIGGFYGTVQSVDADNDVITLIVGPDKTRLMVARWAIRNVNEEVTENETPVEADVKTE